MEEIQEVLSAILKSLLGLAFILISIIFAVFQITYVAISLGIIGFIVCWFSYLNFKIRKEKQKDSSNDNN